MKQRILYIAIVVMTLLVFTGCSATDNDTVTGYAANSLDSDPDKVTVYFFWGDGCPHCANEKPFLADLEEKYPEDLEVKMYETWKHPDNVPLFKEAAQKHGIEARGVPITFIGEKNWVGYTDRMGDEMEGYIQSCIQQDCNDLIAN